MDNMAKNMHKMTQYEDVDYSISTVPPEHLISGHFHCTFGYRVVRPKGAGSWLLMSTCAGRGLLRQPGGLELSVREGDIVLLSPDAYSDYGVPCPQGAPLLPLVERSYIDRFVPFLSVDPQELAEDPTFKYIRLLHLDKRRPPRNPKGSWRFHWTHFQSRKEWTSMIDLLDLPQVGKGLYHLHVADLHERTRIGHAFERMHEDLQSGELLGEQLGSNQLEEILYLLARRAGWNRNRLDPRIAQALEIIGSNPSVDHTRTSLAQQVSMSPSRFASLFKGQTGQGVKQAVIRQRINSAKRMLAMTEERISEIAYALGFSSPFYFSRQFSVWVGQSPRAYRRSIREESLSQAAKAKKRRLADRQQP